MSFLICFNFDYSLFSNLFHLRPPYLTFWSILNFLVFCVLGVIFDFFIFLKMSFWIFFNSDFSLFSKLFSFEASLHEFLKFFVIFLVLECFWGHSWVFKILQISSLIFFNSDYSLFFNLFSFMASLHDFLKFLEFLVFGCFWVIFVFLKFLQMSFLIFVNSDYSLFLKLFSFVASLHYFLKFFEFLVFGCYLCHFWVFEMFENVILNII